MANAMDAAKDMSSMGGNEDAGEEIAIDAKTIAAAFKSLAEQQEKIDEENAEAQRELLKVKVDKVDVKFLAAQLNMTMPSAELLLRQNGGCLKATLNAFVSQAPPAPVIY